MSKESKIDSKKEKEVIWEGNEVRVVGVGRAKIHGELDIEGLIKTLLQQTITSHM